MIGEERIEPFVKFAFPPSSTWQQISLGALPAWCRQILNMQFLPLQENDILVFLALSCSRFLADWPLLLYKIMMGIFCSA